MLGGFAAACATVLIFVHYPLPWDVDQPLELPPIYTMGSGSRCCWRSASSAPMRGSSPMRPPARRRARRHRAVLAREQHLSQLDGLAAAAAHELGTPCPPSRHRHRDRARDGARFPHADDVKLLREQRNAAAASRQAHAIVLERRAFDRMPCPGSSRRPWRRTAISVWPSPWRWYPTTRPADRPAQSGHPLWARQSLGECRRFRPRAGRCHRRMERAGDHLDDQRRWAGISRPRSWTGSASLM